MKDYPFDHLKCFETLRDKHIKARQLEDVVITGKAMHVHQTDNACLLSYEVELADWLSSGLPRCHATTAIFCTHFTPGSGFHSCTKLECTTTHSTSASSTAPLQGCADDMSHSTKDSNTPTP